MFKKSNFKPLLSWLTKEIFIWDPGYDLRIDNIFKILPAGADSFILLPFKNFNSKVKFNIHTHMKFQIISNFQIFEKIFERLKISVSLKVYRQISQDF